VILGAGLLLLLGLGLLVAGVLTGVTALYWACVAVCLVAAVLLVLVRRQMAAERATTEQVVAGRRQERAPETDDRSAEGQTTVLSPPPPPPTGATAYAGGATEPRQPVEPRQSVQPAEPRRSAPRAPAGEPPLEEVEVTDLLLVMDLRDEVLVVDEHPRYHLSGCSYLVGTETFPMPIDEARSDGFTPCGSCAPDRHLAQLARQRKSGRR
jgi:hypothetical protein